MPLVMVPPESMKTYRLNSMVSADHFRYELRLQLRRAFEQGATSIVITASELSKSVRGVVTSMDACCEAMQVEIMANDVLIQNNDSGLGMSVRYQLPRTQRA
jgi:3-keto-L-gulonate-6-phosphate decarboxylase